MKKIALILTSLTIFFSVFSQEDLHKEEGKRIPTIQLKDMDGKSINTSELGFKGPIIIFGLLGALLVKEN